jgi:hypothetical protein
MEPWIMRWLRLAFLPVALMIASAVPTAIVLAADEDCMKGLSNEAGHARKTAGVYIGELKNVKNSPWSVNAASVCNSALSRADQYYSRQTSDQSVCTDASSYVDDQVIHLYRNAVVTCRSSYEDFLKTISPKEQRRMTQRVDVLLNESK